MADNTFRSVGYRVGSAQAGLVTSARIGHAHCKNGFIFSPLNLEILRESPPDSQLEVDHVQIEDQAAKTIAERARSAPLNFGLGVETAVSDEK
jgi:hypothetical protein